jgi:hypothetical protein
VHGSDPDQKVTPAFNGMVPVSARRTPIACRNCAKTKTKCDQQVPCSRCAGRGIVCTPRAKGRAIQDATSVYEVMPPEGLAVSHSHNALAAITDNGRLEAPVQTTNESPGQGRPMPELGSSVNELGSIPEYRKTDLFVDESTPQSCQSLASEPTTLSSTKVLSCSPQEQRAFSQNPFMSVLDESDHMSTAQSGLGSSPRFMLNWTQVQTISRSNGTNRLVQPILSDPSISHPYQDLDGTIPVIADERHMHPSRRPFIVTHAPTSDHPHIAGRDTARDSTLNLRKWHDS